MTKIIHLVGNSGTGKSTVIGMLRREIESEGYSVETLTEPGPLRNLIKEYRSKPENERDPFVEAAMFAVDRFITYKNSVLPRMDEKNLVFLFDRGLPESVVYQGIIGGADVPSIFRMNSSIPQSDLYLCLTVNGKTGYDRIKAREAATGEAITRDEAPERIDMLAEGYKKAVKYFNNMHIIDTTELTIDSVFLECMSHISGTLKG